MYQLPLSVVLILKCLQLDAVVKCPSKSEKDFHKDKQSDTFVFPSTNWQNTYKVTGEVGFYCNHFGEQGKEMLKLQTGPLEQILQSGVNFNNICSLKGEDEKRNQGVPSSIFRLK